MATAPLLLDISELLNCASDVTPSTYRPSVSMEHSNFYLVSIVNSHITIGCIYRIESPTYTGF